MSGLRVSPDLELPLDFATEAWAILARRGAGKSNAGVVIAEELYRNGMPFVAIDPKGDWWGIRSSADGDGEGLAVPVFGGRHGDVPLEASAGHLIADLVLGEQDQGSYLSVVLDVSEFTKGEARRFLQEFAERLFRRKDESGVLTLIFEEAHEYLPQRVTREDAPLVGAFQRIVKQGRQRGLGCGMLTQRSASLNKDVLTQVGALIPMRIMSPQDRLAIKDWVSVSADAGTTLLDTLHSLQPGEGYIWWPDVYETPQRLMFHRRWTFDSGATPKPGEARPIPRTLADVDLAAVKEAMADTIERAEADDPRLLHREIDQLRSEIDAHVCTGERVEVPVLTDKGLDPLRLLLHELDQAAMRIEQLSGRETPTKEAAPARVEATNRGSSAPRRPQQPPGEVVKPGAASEVPGGSRRAERDAPAGLDRAARAVLSVLAQYPNGRSMRQLAMLTGYSPKASTLGVALSKLRKAGYVTASGQPTITQAGLDNTVIVPLPQGEELLRYWLGHASLDRAARVVLEYLVESYPDPRHHEEICNAAGYSTSASTVGVALSKLRKLELVEGWALSADFAAAIGRSR